ncbi:MAG: ATP-dependent RNA helicase RhlB, partial [Haliea sp.]
MIKSLLGRGSNGASSAASPAPTPESPSSDSTHGKPPRSPGHSDRGQGRSGRSRPRQAAPSGDTWSLDDFQVPPQEGQTRFHDLGLRDELMRGIAD